MKKPLILFALIALSQFTFAQIMDEDLNKLIFQSFNQFPSEKILVTKDVENTADEAVAVKGLISPSKRIILVTSAYHMYRAQRLFEKQGFEVVSYKVDYKATRNQTKNIIDFYLTEKT